MDKSTLLPIALLYTEGSASVDGATRMQKLVFLAQKEGNLSDFYDFEPGDFGPFSADLARDLNELDRRGVIEVNKVQNEMGQEKYVFGLTKQGIRVAKNLLQKEGVGRIFDEVEGIKREYNNQLLNNMLQYVYRKYDSYTTETNLDTEALFDPDATSEFLEPEVDNAPYRKFIQDAVAFENEDGTWTARDTDLHLTALGDSREDALDNLGKVIAAAQGEAGREPTDEEIADMGVDPEKAKDDTVNDVPGFME